jgi:branched-chain amino acid transport system ATP-binding protein
MTVLSVTGVSHRFGGVRALTEVTFAVDAGQVVGLVGPNGAGKTTLLSIIAGALRPTTGQLTMRGRTVRRWSPHRAARAGVARTFQIPRQFGSMTVLDNITTAAHLHHRSTTAARGAALQLCHALELEEMANHPVGELSVTSRRRLELARALATEPRLLLLDEVMAGLTPTETNNLVHTVQSIADSGVTILLIEHVMTVITALCQRVLVLDTGRLIADAPPEQALTDPAVVTAYLGADADA